MYFRCDNILKVWPRVGPHVFKCQIGQECDPERLEKLAKNEEVGEKGGFESSTNENRQFISCANNGESRYCCFEDGFDVCNLCAEEVLSSKAPLTASTMGGNNTSTSNGSSASKQLNGGWFDVQLKTISQTVQEETEKNGIIRNGKVIIVQNEV